MCRSLECIFPSIQLNYRQNKIGFVPPEVLKQRILEVFGKLQPSVNEIKEKLSAIYGPASPVDEDVDGDLDVSGAA